VVAAARRYGHFKFFWRVPTNSLTATHLEEDAEQSFEKLLGDNFSKDVAALRELGFNTPDMVLKLTEDRLYRLLNEGEPNREVPENNPNESVTDPESDTWTHRTTLANCVNLLDMLRECYVGEDRLQYVPHDAPPSFHDLPCVFGVLWHTDVTFWCVTRAAGTAGGGSGRRSKSCTCIPGRRSRPPPSVPSSRWTVP